MAYKVHMGQDGILRIEVIGDFGDRDSEESTREMVSFLEAATPDKPLLMLSDVSQAGKLSAGARRTIAQQGQDPRMGRNAVLGVSRYARVMVSFLSKASGHDNIRFFDDEEKALAWLKEGR
jgi:hypothetical protein